MLYGSEQEASVCLPQLSQHWPFRLRLGLNTQVGEQEWGPCPTHHPPHAPWKGPGFKLLSTRSPVQPQHTPGEQTGRQANPFHLKCFSFSGKKKQKQEYELHELHQRLQIKMLGW